VVLYVSIHEFKSQATDVEDVVLEAAKCDKLNPYNISKDCKCGDHLATLQLSKLSGISQFH
jgi:hypothetical protein